MLKLDKASVGYNRKVIIDNIEIEVKPGEILSLIGPNGAGKSTILKTIIKQLALIDGAVVVDGKNLEGTSEKELSKITAMVMTEKIKTEYMSCKDIVAMGRYPYTGMLGNLTARDEEKVIEALKRVEAEELVDADFMKISDGQKQRVMLAKALCQEPKLLVLDEPTSYLDMKYKRSLMSIIRELAIKDNISIIMSLHEVELAKRVSDKIACVKDGKLECVGTPEDIFADSYIEKLYDLDEGSYDDDLGILELPKVCGEPKVFVIGGGGSAINCYYKLQRKQIPFAAGIIHSNDVEYKIANKLAVKLVSEKAFSKIEESKLETAKDIINNCEKVICMVSEFGEYNQINEKLLQYAKELDKIVDIRDI